MDISFTDNDKEVIKKTNFVFNFSITKTFLGTFVGPFRRVSEGPGVHLVVVCMGLHGLHEFAVFSRGQKFNDCIETLRNVIGNENNEIDVTITRVIEHQKLKM